MFEFAITTDYVAGRGSPLPYLERIARAGWKWVHWCHEWNTTHLYTGEEIDQIETCLRSLGLRVLDIHGSAGFRYGCRWDSPRSILREGGVELVRNRIEMAYRLGCDTVIMHPAELHGSHRYRDKVWSAFRRSVDALLDDCRRYRVRLAMENMEQDNFDQLEGLMSLYPPDRVGLCYDPGHGFIAGNGLERLEPLAERLIALHLNDNDGRRDLHQLPFMGKVDWPRLAQIIKCSGYDRPAMSVEAMMRHAGIGDETTFLINALAAARRFESLLSS